MSKLLSYNTCLSKEQEELLLTMITFLFPSNKLRYCPHRGLIFITDSDGDEYSYHWYSFMMLNLAERIFFREPYQRNTMDKYLNFCKLQNIYFTEGTTSPFYAIHPVNYLYLNTSWNGQKQ